jgi:hypothetical protein
MQTSAGIQAELWNGRERPGVPEHTAQRARFTDVRERGRGSDSPARPRRYSSGSRGML